MVMREIFGVRRRGPIPSPTVDLIPRLAKSSETAVTLTTIGVFGGGEHLLRFMRNVFVPVFPVPGEFFLRPRQDSNLRHRLRRAIRFVQTVLPVRPSRPELASESTR